MWHVLLFLFFFTITEQHLMAFSCECEWEWVQKLELKNQLIEKRWILIQRIYFRYNTVNKYFDTMKVTKLVCFSNSTIESAYLFHFCTFLSFNSHDFGFTTMFACCRLFWAKQQNVTCIIDSHMYDGFYLWIQQSSESIHWTQWTLKDVQCHFTKINGA